MKYIPMGNCPYLTIVNHGPDTISFYTKDGHTIRINNGDSDALWPIVGSPVTNEETYAINGGTVLENRPYSYDIGLKCSPLSPELRKAYNVYSTVILREDMTSPSGLSVSVTTSNEF
ncbi:hypothetical protein [Deinococcus sp. UYEF24]